MRRAVSVGMVAALLCTLSACGTTSSGTKADDPVATTTTATVKTTSTTVVDEVTTTTEAKPTSAMVGLPSPLPKVEDPGTVDPRLGSFPTDEARDYQYAWVNLAPSGRKFVEDLRQQLDVLKELSEGDVYIDGVHACVDLRENYSVDETARSIGQLYKDFLEEAMGEAVSDEDLDAVGAGIVDAAAKHLCPDLAPVLADPDYFTDTPVVLRTLLGVNEEALSNTDANRFANGVCKEVTRGKTVSRLASTVAEDFDYPDDLAESLINYVNNNVCS